jgi:hypothetical protein
LVVDLRHTKCAEQLVEKYFAVDKVKKSVTAKRREREREREFSN